MERRSERADTAYSPRFCEEEPSATDNEIQDLLLAAERRSERGDSAYSPRAPRGGAFGRRQRVNSGEGLYYLLKISSRTFFGASSNWSVSIEYEARPFVRERIAVA